MGIGIYPSATGVTGCVELDCIGLGGANCFDSVESVTGIQKYLGFQKTA
jgi:hypothetical protein